jgi:hypothetical protein
VFAADVVGAIVSGLSCGDLVGEDYNGNTVDVKSALQLFNQALNQQRGYLRAERLMLNAATGQDEIPRYACVTSDIAGIEPCGGSTRFICPEHSFDVRNVGNPVFAGGDVTWKRFSLHGCDARAVDIFAPPTVVQSATTLCEVPRDYASTRTPGILVTFFDVRISKNSDAITLMPECLWPEFVSYGGTVWFDKKQVALPEASVSLTLLDGFLECLCIADDTDVPTHLKLWIEHT